MVFGKWGGRPHWEYDALRLGEDGHGTWLGVPVGSHIARPGAAFTTREQQVVLVPDDGYVATFYAPGSDTPCDVYVDITTVASHRPERISAVDLDLDVLRGWTGRVWVDDEDEFADHQVRFGYPVEVVDLAVRSCDAVRAAVTAAAPPFDADTARGWFGALDDVVSSR